MYSPDERYAYVFGRDGGLTKVDIVKRKIANRVVQAGNSIGGAISDDGKLVAVSNYEPGGVRVFDADTLELVADIRQAQKPSGWLTPPVVALFSPCGTRARHGLPTCLVKATPQSPKFPIWERTLMTRWSLGNGRTYITGLFGEDGLTALDLWADNPPTHPRAAELWSRARGYAGL